MLCSSPLRLLVHRVREPFALAVRACVKMLSSTADRGDALAGSDAILDLVSSDDEQAAPVRSRPSPAKKPARALFAPSNAFGGDSEDDDCTNEANSHDAASQVTGATPQGASRASVRLAGAPADGPPGDAAASGLSDSEDEELLAPIHSETKRPPTAVKSLAERIAKVEASCAERRARVAGSRSLSCAGGGPSSTGGPQARSEPPQARSEPAKEPNRPVLESHGGAAVETREDEYADAGKGNDLSELVPDLNQNHFAINSPLFQEVFVAPDL